MRSSVISNVVRAALVAGLACAGGCSGDSAPRGNPFATGGASGSSTGAGGSGGAAGGGGGGGAGAMIGSGGAGGAIPATGGAGGADPDAGATDSGGGSGGSGGSVDAGDAGGPDGMIGASAITRVVPTAGCGKDPGTTGRGTIATMGTKVPGCADSRCGPWMYTREYFVTLPQGYSNTKAYPLVFQGPGCAGVATAVYPLNNNVDNTVIRVGLTPPPDDIGHATNPGQGCFDDKEGDDSVDWVFYETLHDKLAQQLCFDRNRVFASGNSSGAWLANEIGCKYAGDDTRPIRGILTNGGALPTDPRYLPACTTKPMAGMWIYEPLSESVASFSGVRIAIARAMKVNGCTIGTALDSAQLDNFPIGGGNPDTTCKKIQGCPDLDPLVVCALPGNSVGSHDDVANPGFSRFIKLFSAPPLLTP